MTTQFTWIPIYQELADELAKWQDRQEELIAFLEGLRANDYIITPFLDRDDDGARFSLKEIDPFTFLGVFNRGIRNEHRVAILSQMKQKFNLQSQLPIDFDAIPILNNQSSWFFSFQGKRKAGDVEKLWRVFQLALKENPLNHMEFPKAFDDALTVRRTNINLTMGLFWIRPNTFLSLDQTNRTYLGIKLPSEGLNANFYLEILKSFQSNKNSFPELSLEAWKFANSETHSSYLTVW
jgi:5-methylcytosine-specific restriction protein B